jgi:hypothetical protein
VCVGGDTAPTQSPSDPATANQFRAVGASGTIAPAGSGGVSVSFKPTEKKDLSCGGYRWKGFWQLGGATPQNDGFVVQKLTYSFEDYPCENRNQEFNDPKRQAINLGATYWEAWEVQGGSIVGIPGLSGSDTFEVGSLDGYYGLNFQEGQAKYMDGYTEPRKWGTIPEAGSAPATRSQPPGWSDAGTLDRWAKSDFNCCAKDLSSSKFTTSDGAT